MTGVQTCALPILTFLLEAAFEEIFPDGILTVDHSVTSGGYYCQVGGRPPLTDRELTALENRMRELVAQNLPFERLIVPLQEAIQYFESKGYHDKVRLLRYRNRDKLVLYQMGSHRDYHHGYMVPSTGYLRWFGLKAMDDGFILQYPRRHAPTEIQPLPDYVELRIVE